MENYKLKQVKKFKYLCKYGKKNYKIWWYWNRKTKMYQYKRSASIQIIDIIEIVASNKANKGFFGKKGFKYFIS